MSPEEEKRLVQERLLAAIPDIVAGTTWAPPKGGLFPDAVLVMGWTDSDGDWGTSQIATGSPWASHGLLSMRLCDLGEPDRE